MPIESVGVAFDGDSPAPSRPVTALIPCATNRSTVRQAKVDPANIADVMSNPLL